MKNTKLTVTNEEMRVLKLAIERQISAAMVQKGKSEFATWSDTKVALAGSPLMSLAEKIFPDYS